ncbi:MAG: hypothetical protein HY259_14225 [Chloroflexi bacterium]|nr:hypothetical protein [Chloroflexota bacterium]
MPHAQVQIVKPEVVDALAYHGVTNMDIPLTPPKVWAALKKKGVALWS